MKRLLSIFIAFVFAVLMVLIPVYALSAPFLICDPQASAEWYVLEMDGIELPGVYDAEPDGSLKYDLAGIVVGQHSVRALAGNMWGQSVYSDPFDFSKELPVVPGNLRLSVQ